MRSEPYLIPILAIVAAQYMQCAQAQISLRGKNIRRTEEEEASFSGKFNCHVLNPCHPLNTKRYGYYYPFEGSPCSYVQCGAAAEECFVQHCPPSTVWNQFFKTCTYDPYLCGSLQWDLPPGVKDSDPHFYSKTTEAPQYSEITHYNQQVVYSEATKTTPQGNAEERPISTIRAPLVNGEVPDPLDTTSATQSPSYKIEYNEDMQHSASTVDDGTSDPMDYSDATKTESVNETDAT